MKVTHYMTPAFLNFDFLRFCDIVFLTTVLAPDGEVLFFFFLLWSLAFFIVLKTG